MSDIDPYEMLQLMDGREFHSILRRKGPLVWLSRYGTWATGRHREITAIGPAAALNHPNICAVHEIDEADGKSFIAMAVIVGESLGKKISQRPLEPHVVPKSARAKASKTSQASIFLTTFPSTSVRRKSRPK